MEIEFLRDVVIIVFGIIGTLCFALAILVVFLLYNRLKLIFSLTADSVAGIKEIFVETGEAIKPIIQISAIIDAATKGVGFINKIFGEKKEGKKMERDRWTSFGVGILAGAVVGGVIALLYAPKSGKELRHDIQGKAGEVFEAGKAKVGDMRHMMGEKISGEECYQSVPKNGD